MNVFDDQRTTAPRLGDDLVDLLPELVQLGRDAGLADEADSLAALGDQTMHPGAIVAVVGESSVGKTSLINSILGQPVLPPGSTGATGTQLIVRHGDRPRATVTLATGPTRTAEIDLSELPRYATRAGTLSHRTVRAVIEVPNELLRSGLTIVDTPSLDALNPSLRSQSRAAIERAHAVLFVTDASGPINGDELKMLDFVGEQLSTVLLVMTKVDLHPHWEVVLEESLDSVRQTVSVVGGVSAAPVALNLDTTGLDEEDRQQVAEESGMAEVLEFLRTEVIDRRDGLILFGLRRRMNRLLGRVEELQAIRLETAEPDPSIQHEIDRDTAAITRLQQESATWRNRISDQFESLRIGIGERLRNRVKVEITPLLAAVEEVDPRKPEEGEAIEASVQQVVEGVFYRNLEEIIKVSERLRRETSQSLADEVGSIELPPPVQATPEVSPLGSVEYDSEEMSNLEKVGMIQTAALFGTQAHGVMAISIASVSIPGWPFLVAGAVAATIMAKLDRDSRNIDKARAKVHQSVVEYMESASTELIVHLTSLVISARGQVINGIEQALDGRRRELEALLADRERLARFDAEEKESARDEAAGFNRRAENLRRQLAEISLTGA